MANRVAEIQSLYDNIFLCHVSPRNNLADILSRGAYANELLNNDFWRHGLEFLNQEIFVFQEIPVSIGHYDGELKHNITLLTVNNNSFVDAPLTMTNDFVKLIRICSYIFRFINYTPKKVQRHKYISTSELHFATEFLIKKALEGKFAYELDSLQKGCNVSSTIKLKSLDPFFDPLMPSIN